ncbi:tRNA (guanine(46)-N(7))-methyltransferase TrmB [Methyloversatilis thermotolerans]|uniref:tRNA (guanine(46)-N(7))-methyltransferase TrmB n=1 Tax=Methyloversatilis thermotolerans TaxID=1346290 RepID=UPI00036AD5A3|nr:methyltransferase domain-containing protein [Methyloversatilis thermotolerans]
MNAAGAASRVPTSAQQGPHDQLTALIARRTGHPFRRPAAAYSAEAFSVFQAFCAPGEALIIDSCCGTGESTRHLAESHPRHKVVGVDQSAHRLSRAPAMPPNGLLLRADMVDVWQLMHAQGYRPDAQYMLYPNPWPKIGHVARRWPAHPVFPTVLALGGRIECRSNWRIYVEEFALAVRLLTGREASVWSFVPDPVLTPFERKYTASGHTLFRCVVDA